MDTTPTPTEKVMDDLLKEHEAENAADEANTNTNADPADAEAEKLRQEVSRSLHCAQIGTNAFPLANYHFRRCLKTISRQKIPISAQELDHERPPEQSYELESSIRKYGHHAYIISNLKVATANTTATRFVCIQFPNCELGA